jgi:hypothetical protein
LILSRLWPRCAGDHLETIIIAAAVYRLAPSVVAALTCYDLTLALTLT